MAYAEQIERGLDYALCRYGGSRLTFRGPRKRLTGAYAAVLGGSETFGRYIEEPFPDMVQGALGVRCVNFGQVNAGLDVFLKDETVMEACAGAALTVMQIVGAGNLSNHFYAVHPRRNDRFISVSLRMRKVFPDVDFTEFHFTRHMLSTLEAESPQRFRLVRDELRRSWVQKMNQLSARIRTRMLLFWVGDRRPDDRGDWTWDGEPLFITRQMLEALRGRIAGIVELPPMSSKALEGKVFLPGEERSALLAPGPGVHEALAKALVGEIRQKDLLA